MNAGMKAIDLDERCAAPGEDDQKLSGIEVTFAMPIYLSYEQQLKLAELLERIVNDPKNTPKEGVHWLGTVGGKMNFSEVDCKLLGVKPGPNPPPDGDEPGYDDTVLCFGTLARSFNSEKERADALERRRKSEFTCPKCGGHAFGSHGADDDGQHNRYCNGRGQRGKIVDSNFVPTEGPDEPRIRCDFTWPEADDAKYGLKPP